MLDMYLKTPKTIQRLRSGPLGCQRPADFGQFVQGVRVRCPEVDGHELAGWH
jgi:hypothetical protein